MSLFQTRMTEAISQAQESAKEEIRSLERWYNTSRAQIIQELDRITNLYYERSSEINTKWATYMYVLDIQPRQYEDHRDQGPMCLDELSSPDDSIRTPPLGSSSGVILATDDDLMAMKSGLPRTDHPMTLSELATKPASASTDDVPMTLSELATEPASAEEYDDVPMSISELATKPASASTDDVPMTLSELATEPASAEEYDDVPMSISELVMASGVDNSDNNEDVRRIALDLRPGVRGFSRATADGFHWMNTSSPRGVADLDLSDDDYDDEYYADHPSAVLYDDSNRMQLEELDIYNGYDESYSLDSDDGQEDQEEDTEYDENAMEICS